jgi:3'-5' exoribonuclease
VSRLPRLSDLTTDDAGHGFFLCTLKEVRPTKVGTEFLDLRLQDATGQVVGRLFDDVSRYSAQFDAGDFVRVEGRGQTFNGQLQLKVTSIRRVHPEQDRREGFREEDCVLSAPRPIGEMWQELEARVAAVSHPSLRVLLRRVLDDHGLALREWPAAQTIHHAYRGGFLEHLCTMAAAVADLARLYEADADLLLAGVILHDIGKLQELSYERGVVSYTRDGNLLGHIAQGLLLVRTMAGQIPGFPDDLRVHLEHLILSHHGSREHGSPVEPKTVEAFILAAADDLDARLNQVRRAIAEDGGDGEFTAWHRKLNRVFYKGPSAG